MNIQQVSCFVNSILIIFLLICIDTTRKLKYNICIKIMKVGDAMSVGSRIKELRENRGLSRGELADLLNVTVGSISNYENEVSSPKKPILFKIMEALKCDANYLFQDAIDIPSMENSVSINEYEIIKKYRGLDNHGKEMVDFTLDKEYERCVEEKHRLAAFEESHLTPVAAHNDDESYEQEQLMREDLDEL